MKRTGITMSALVAAAALLAQVPAAATTAPQSTGTTAPKPTITVTVAEVIRVDQQDTLPTVVFSGVSSKDRLRVNWGDGRGIDASRGQCTIEKAAAKPKQCRVTLTHRYLDPGTFTIAATAGKVRTTRSVVVAPVPVAWTPPAGWVQPANWGTTYGATFTPCQNVPWFFDASQLPADRANLKADVAAALDLLAVETGLTFTEVVDEAEAKLLVGAEPMAEMEAAGGFMAVPGVAAVMLATDDPYTLDAYQGFGLVHFVYQLPDWTFDEMVPGRGWMVTRLIMGSLGLMLGDYPEQLMSREYFPPAGFGAGDLDGLHTMYKNLGCPLIPD